jgi:hypothetical protein
MKNCSYCGRDNADDAILCRECATEFVTDAIHVADSQITMKCIVPLIFLLQGLCPIFIFGCLAPNRDAYIIVAVIYALIAMGLWRAKRWVFILAFLTTLAQTMTISSPSFVWDFAPGFKCGLYFTHLHYGVFCYVGAHFDAYFHTLDPRILKMYSFIHEDKFVLLNLFAVILTILLFIQFRRIKLDNEQAA